MTRCKTSLITRLDRLGASELHTEGVMPSGKIKSLLHFLDHVDQVENLENVDTTSCLSGVDSVV